MLRIAPGVYLETKYPSVQLGIIVTDEGLLLIDSPPRVEDGRNWLATLKDYGEPRYMALLDSHPDRVLGARIFDLPLVAHDWTRQLMSNWSDIFKGGARPIGAEADHLKRITGVHNAVPDLTFSKCIILHLGDREVHLWHRPGPTPGSIWVVLPAAKVAFIGDAVTVAEPPFLGEADLEAWMNTLDDLRSSHMRAYKLISSRDGLVKRGDVNDMARFLRKIPWRLERLGVKRAPPEAAANYASQLLEGFKIPSARRDHVLLRLQVGLTRLYSRLYPPET